MISIIKISLRRGTAEQGTTDLTGAEEMGESDFKTFSSMRSHHHHHRRH